MRWLPPVVGIICFLIISFGLIFVLSENLKVAPWAEEAVKGRLHYQTKNSTRITGNRQAVRDLIHQAVYLSESSEQEELSWQEAVKASIRVRANPEHIVVLPQQGNQAISWAMPGAYWAMFYGAPVVFADQDKIAPKDEQYIVNRGLPVYVLAPESLVSSEALRGISGTSIKRVTGPNLFQFAVNISEAFDSKGNFGWNRDFDRREGYFEFVVTTPSEVLLALESMPLAKSNAASLLYVKDDGGISAETDRYLWQKRSGFFVTPSEGPFHHLWVIGNKVSYATQSRLDHAIEKGPYESRGHTALGPMEGLLLSFIILGIGGGVFVFIHSTRFLAHVSLSIRLAWTMSAALLPVLGVLLYFSAYRRLRIDSENKMARYLRPASIQSAAATVMGFGYGAPIMIVIGYMFVWFGMPQFFGEWSDGVRFVFGSGMVLMMAAMWLGAILIAWLFVHWPMQRTMMPEMPTAKVGLRSLSVTALSMTAVSLGMMTIAWWMQMEKLPMMPHEDEILWFGAMWLASFIGFLVAWPLNYPMVRSRLKMGGM